MKVRSDTCLAQSSIRIITISALLLASTACVRQTRPNLLFILSDDQRWDSLGCMGNTVVQTPNIDALAKRGVLFTNNFVTTSICAISRASFFSGQYARRHRIEDFSTPFKPEAFSLTYPALLRKSGYRTGFVGKWGLGEPRPAAEFDYFTGYEGQGRYFGAGDKEKVHLTRRLGNEVIEFLRTQKSGQPFCLSISFKAPHVDDGGPIYFRYDPAHEGLYQNVTIPLPPLANHASWEAMPEFIRNSEGHTRWKNEFATPEMFQTSAKSYYRLITGMDETIGEILKELERTGAAKNTVIIFTSDNGFFLGERELEGKWLMYEESIRTPLVIYSPNLPSRLRGARREEMTLNIDIAPTLLDLAGVPIPETMQGKSILPLVRGEHPRWREDFFYEHHFAYGGKIPQTEGVRSRDWKYTQYLGTSPSYEELFDLKNDPHEERNLAAEKKPEIHARLEAMRKRCDEYRTSLK